MGGDRSITASRCILRRRPTLAGCCARYERPRRRAAKPRDELPPSHRRSLAFGPRKPSAIEVVWKWDCTCSGSPAQVRARRPRVLGLPASLVRFPIWEAWALRLASGPASRPRTQYMVGVGDYGSALPIVLAGPTSATNTITRHRQRRPHLHLHLHCPFTMTPSATSTAN
jgi:hypothetical protein